MRTAQSGQEHTAQTQPRYWKTSLVIPLFCLFLCSGLFQTLVLLLYTMWHTRMDTQLYIIVFGSMGGKTECSKIQAFWGSVHASWQMFCESWLACSYFLTRQHQIPELIISFCQFRVNYILNEKHLIKKL